MAWMLLLLGLSFQDTPEALVEKLRSDRIEERDEAERRLRELGRAAVPALERAAKDPDPEMAARASRLLRISAVLEGLTPFVKRVVPDAEARIVRGGERSCAEILLKLARDEKSPVCAREDLEPLAGLALGGAWGKEQKVQVLRVVAQFDLHSAEAATADLLADPLGAVRAEALETLGWLHARTRVPQIAGRLADRGAGVRRQAAETLSDLGEADQAGALLKLLEDPDVSVRATASAALADFGARETVPGLVKLLKEGRSPQAVDALMVLAPSEAVPFLVPRTHVFGDAWNAAYLLGKAGAIKELEALIRHGNPDVRSPAADAIGSLRLLDAAPALRRILETEGSRVDPVLVEALGRLKDRESIPALQALLKDPAAEARREAAGALAAMGVAEVVPVLRSWMAPGAEEGLRSTAVRALQCMQASEAAPEFTVMLGAKADADRENALEFLGDAGVVEAVPRIIPLLKDKEEYVRARAAEALALLGAKESVSAILPLLDEPETAGPAIWALARLGAREHLSAMVRSMEKGEGREEWVVPALERLGGAEVVAAMAKLLGSRESEVRRQALLVLDALDAGDPAADVLPLLADKESHRATALFLCRRGRREGVPFILQGEFGIETLNAVRRPEVWKRLRGLRAAEDFPWMAEEAVRRVAREAGLELDWRPSSRSVVVCGAVRTLVPRHREPRSLLQALEDLRISYTTSFILEKDRIRVVPRTQALLFWREWWHAGGKD